MPDNWFADVRNTVLHCRVCDSGVLPVARIKMFCKYHHK